MDYFVCIITGLGIPESDTTYTSGTGLNLSDTVFSIDSTVVTSNYAGTVTATAFSGSGASLTGVVASSVSDAGLTLISGKTTTQNILSTLVGGTPTTGQSLKWNGSAWIPTSSPTWATWAPSPNLSATVNSARYVDDGNTVHFQISLTTSSTSADITVNLPSTPYASTAEKQ